MFWCRHNRDKPVEATPKYLPTIHYLKPFQTVLKSKTLTVRAVINHCVVKREKHAYPQMSKMADNLRFQMKILHEIRQV